MLPKFLNYRNVIIFFSSLTIIYVIFKIIYMNENIIIEGLTNNKGAKERLQDIQKQITSMNNNLSDILNIEKNKSDYENMIIELDELTDKIIISTLVSQLENSSGNELNEKLIDEINSLVNFKNNLNEVMNSLDKASK
jgi:superoxide dismutase